MASVIIVQKPERQIKRAVESDDWISAYAIAVSYFEYYGSEIINRRGELLTVPKLGEKVGRMKVGGIVLVLRLLDAIDQDTYRKMTSIIEERNKLIHLTRKGTGYPIINKKEREAEILGNGIDCLQKLEKALQ